MRRNSIPSRGAAADRTNDLFAQAVGLHQRGLIAEAERLYRLVLAADKKYGGALQYLAMLEGERGNYVEACRLLEQCVRYNPRSAEARTNLGYALALMGRHDDALASYDKALSIDPNFLAALNNRGISLRELKRFADAVANYDRALAIRPDFADALYNRGNVLNKMGRWADALASFDRALAIRPNDPSTWIGRATALRGLGRLAEAVASLDRTLASAPNNVLALVNRGHILSDLRRHEDAIASYARALQIDPSHPHARSPMAWAAMAICDWSLSEKIVDELEKHVREHRCVVQPFTFLSCCGDPALQLICAKSFVADAVPAVLQLLSGNQDPRRDENRKLRVGYLSSDFRQHPMVCLIARLLELHDRSQFEILGVSIGKDDASDERRRIMAAVDEFHSVDDKSDDEIAVYIRKQQVDILVDLNGHTQGGRIGILARRPAPVQASYIGYPGTSGADFIDYMITDGVVVPTESESVFSEKIVRLPDFYLAYNLDHEIVAPTPARREAGLGDHGFVFCCFNNNYKITRPVFDVWMRLLQSVEASVLWLISDTPAAEMNLRKEAAKRGVDPARLVFAPRVSQDQHLARHALADLFLDTAPVNAHTTACDALWMGLPLVTFIGHAFVGRVAASLLTSVGLPDLVTTTLANYEALALKLATDPALLQGYRERLRDRASRPPFAPDRLRRQIEPAYVRMWDIWRQGEKPQGFKVERE